MAILERCLACEADAVGTVGVWAEDETLVGEVPELPETVREGTNV